jgi:hypothetical protein
MTPSARWSAHAAVFAAAATGLPLLWTRYVAPVPEDLDPPPIDATAQHWHVLLVPLLVFLLGVLWPLHVLPALRARRALRASGLALLALAAVMIASGYVAQVLLDEGWRRATGWIHALSSALWLVAFVLHVARAPRAPSPANGRARPDHQEAGRTNSPEPTRRIASSSPGMPASLQT